MDSMGSNIMSSVVILISSELFFFFCNGPVGVLFAVPILRNTAYDRGGYEGGVFLSAAHPPKHGQPVRVNRRVCTPVVEEGTPIVRKCYPPIPAYWYLGRRGVSVQKVLIYGSTTNYINNSRIVNSRTLHNLIITIQQQLRDL